MRVRLAIDRRSRDPVAEHERAARLAAGRPDQPVDERVEPDAVRDEQPARRRSPARRRGVARSPPARRRAARSTGRSSGCRRPTSTMSARTVVVAVTRRASGSADGPIAAAGRVAGGQHDRRGGEARQDPNPGPTATQSHDWTCRRSMHWHACVVRPAAVRSGPSAPGSGGRVRRARPGGCRCGTRTGARSRRRRR